MTAYTYGHLRPSRPPVLMRAEDEGTCTTCDGSGVVAVPTCTGGSDHTGQNCGGRVCGDAEGDCPDCGDPHGLREFDAEGV